jgi:hypothetical protein
MVGIFEPACELLPPWMKELMFLYLFSDLPPFPKLMYSIYRQCLAGVGGLGGGGGVLNCVVDHILQEFSTLLLTRFRTYKIASPTPNKNDQ